MRNPWPNPATGFIGLFPGASANLTSITGFPAQLCHAVRHSGMPLLFGALSGKQIQIVFVRVRFNLVKVSFVTKR